MQTTKIEWTGLTWNPTTGCNKKSSGCKNCYAERMSKRLKAMGQEKYKDGFEFKIHPDELYKPYKWRGPKMVFVNSMSDLFHEKCPQEFIEHVFSVMNENPNLTFQVLTKRSDILKSLCRFFTWTDNIWMGVSVENEKVMHRIDDLKQTPAKVKFLSLEPLLGPLPGLDITGIDWVIVGGESGPKARPIKEEWVIDIRDACQKAGVPFFFKQWGGTNKKKTGRLLQGKQYNEMPLILSK